MDDASFGRYRLQELIGEGGMGQVYKAHDTATDRVVALKVLPAHLAADSEFRERFRREARVTAALREPHVVPIHDFGEIDGRLYLDMRLIEGADVRSILSRYGPMPVAVAVSVVDQVAAALDAAHADGLVHRDVKPSNILVSARNFAYLIDFGIARVGGEAGLTGTGATMGTLAYMAPERFTAGHGDARSDVYALACVLHECLTGMPPFPGDSPEQQLSAHLAGQPPRPSAGGVPVPVGFDAVVARGMAKDPADRYPSAGALAAAAHQALASAASAAAEPRVRMPDIEAAPTVAMHRAADDAGRPRPTLRWQSSIAIDTPAGPTAPAFASVPVNDRRTRRRLPAKKLAWGASAAGVAAAIAVGVVLATNTPSAPPSDAADMPSYTEPVTAPAPPAPTPVPALPAPHLSPTGGQTSSRSPEPDAPPTQDGSYDSYDYGYDVP
ncbi:serine/threonine-protein kinase [Rhodococcus sp. NPDC059234]|uniref:serine/threonine-protein kinase n=1 Tax=Rhodococcus sp. NPDC059234 TaxID=3346781 RepID=UPI00366AFA0E